MRPSVLAVPPDEHAASPEQQSPKRRRDHERRSLQARVLFTGSIVRSANLSTLSSLQSALERSIRTFDHRCQIVEVAQAGLRGVLSAWAER